MADFTRRCSNQAARRYLGPSRPRFTGGVTANLEVEANNFRRLILELDFRFPGLSHQIDGGERDGQRNLPGRLLAPLNPDSEIYLIPKIGGG